MSVVVEEAVLAPRAAQSRRLWVFFGVDCVLATAIRVVLAVVTTGYSSDTQTFQSWAGTLRDHPLGDFYATAYRPDHLPGDLWFLKLTVAVYDALGGHDVDGTGFALLTQVIPIVGDLLVALMLLLLVRDLRDADSAGRVARWYLLNPATILLTGVWGQWDSLSLGILLAGAWCALHRRWWLASAPLLTWAVLIKPQLALPCLCLVLLLGHRLVSDGVRGRLLATRAAGWLTAAVATAYVVLRPFGVGLLVAPAGGSTLAERLHDALGVWPYTTVGAANIWMLPIRTSQIRRSDGGAGWLGVSAQAWGTVLLLLAVLVVVAVAVRRLRPVTVVTAVWAATALAYAAFLLPTRVHERYLFPALGLGLLLAALSSWDRRLVAWFWGISSAFTVNLALVLFGGLHGPDGHTVTFGSGAWLTLTTAMILLFLALLAWPFLRRVDDSPLPATAS
jgi:dolichyl-phosphate-mannose-protein mannosyltransferase